MLLLVAAVVAAGLIALFVIRGSTPGIDVRAHPNRLAGLEQVPVNDTRQWVLIRSENVSNPVVLFLHGGPGAAQLALMRRTTQPLEQHFTVVNWDQRGAGKSFAAGRDRSRMNMAQFVDDVIALSSFLAKRFDRRKILLVGHSWGSAIGMLAVSRRPDLFSAYVGIGQVSRAAESELISYEWTLQCARQASDVASTNTLTAMGPPPYSGDWRSKFIAQRRIVGKYGGEYYGSNRGALPVVLRSLVFSREYTMADRINFVRGLLRSLDCLFSDLIRTDLFVEVPEARIPVYFCLGRHDFEVPSVLSAKYVEFLKAPRKQLVWFEHSSHMVNIEEQQKFCQFLVDTVLPVLDG